MYKFYINIVFYLALRGCVYLFVWLVLKHFFNIFLLFFCSLMRKKRSQRWVSFKWRKKKSLKWRKIDLKVLNGKCFCLLVRPHEKKKQIIQINAVNILYKQQEKNISVDTSMKWNATSFSQANLFKDCAVIEYERNAKCVCVRLHFKVSTNEI